MKQKTVRRFLNRNKWGIAAKRGNISFFRRVNQCKVALGADPLKLGNYSIWERLSLLFR